MKPLFLLSNIAITKLRLPPMPLNALYLTYPNFWNEDLICLESCFIASLLERSFSCSSSISSMISMIVSSSVSASFPRMKISYLRYSLLSFTIQMITTINNTNDRIENPTISTIGSMGILYNILFSIFCFLSFRLCLCFSFDLLHS